MSEVRFPKLVISTAKEPAGYTTADAVTALEDEGIPEAIKAMMRDKLPPGAVVVEWQWSFKTSSPDGRVERIEAGP